MWLAMGGIFGFNTVMKAIGLFVIGWFPLWALAAMTVCYLVVGGYYSFKLTSFERSTSQVFFTESPANTFLAARAELESLESRRNNLALVALGLAGVAIWNVTNATTPNYSTIAILGAAASVSAAASAYYALRAAQHN
ncbi:MAG: hypothetical protein QM775_07210 [Pirellulales bacterium]